MPIKAVLIGLVLLLAGCGQSSVAHLETNPLRMKQEERLLTTYWEFRYVTRMENDHYLVKGAAHHPPQRPPVPRDWIHDLRLSAYLSDANGRVLAMDGKSYVTMRRTPDTMAPFEFRLKPDPVTADQDIFITFGYTMLISDHRFQDGISDKPLSGDSEGFSVMRGPVFR